jgi:hypothetical protein
LGLTKRAGTWPGALGNWAEKYVTAARKHHGEERTDYATAINWLAQLLQATDRLAVATHPEAKK